MLESLKRWASGWVAFFLISLLILSFAIWGVADYVTGRSSSALVTVGGQQITANEFQRAFQDELNSLSQRAGQRITHEQARAVGLDSRVLSQMIGSAAVEAHAQELNLALSNEAIVESLRSDPNFQGADGKFSKEILDGVMRQLGLSEAGLIALRRKDEIRDQLTTAFLRSAVVPAPLVERLHDYRNETRVVEHFTIDAGKVAAVGEPTEESLKQIYEENRRRFMTEPLRHLQVLMLGLDDVKKLADITDEQISAAYEQTKADYDIAEKRRVQQIAFKDKAAAEAALAEIRGGKDFVEVAKSVGATESDIDLGKLERRDLIDKKIAEAAFSLGKDQVSEVIEGDFVTVLLRVVEIEHGRQSTLEEVKDRVRDKLANEWARAELQKLFNRVDDGRAAGTPLKDVAADLQVPFFDLPAVTRLNQTPEGQTALASGDAASIIAAGFSGEVGLESEPVQLPGGGYAFVDVVSTTAAAERPFEEVKDEVRKLWTEIEQSKKLNEVAGKLVERIKSGEDIAKVAEEVGGTVSKTLPVSRETIPEGLTQAAIGQAFVLGEGGLSHGETADGASRSVFRVVEIRTPSPLTPEQTAALERELRQEMRSDQIAQYVAALQQRLGVTIDERAFRRLTGAETQ